MSESVSDYIQDALQRAANDGLIDCEMVTDWIIVGSTILDDGDTGTLLFSPADQTLPRGLGLVGMADVILRESVREWWQG